MMLDTGDPLPTLEPRALSPSMRRTYENRVDALSAEQRAAAAEYEWIYEVRGPELLREMEERQPYLRRFRELLLNGGQA